MGAALWTFANSPLGITIILGVLSAVLGYIFKKKPGWEEAFDKYRPIFMEAVKHAEKAIPDNVEHAGLKKADAALKFVRDIEPKLKKTREVDLRQALEKALEAKTDKETKLMDRAKLLDKLKEDGEDGLKVLEGGDGS